MTGNYLIFVDHRFGAAARRELKRAFPAVVLQQYRRRHSTRFLMLIASSGTDEKGLAAALDESRLVFAEFVLPVDVFLQSTGNGYGNVAEAVSSLLRENGNRRFRLEAVNLDAELADKAKEIEVLLGKRLEASGAIADIAHPELVVYVVFLKEGIAIGHKEVSRCRNLVIDRFRTTRNANVVSRAEFKLLEAIEFFDIDLSRVRTALDIGAAPGGWTHLLSQRGISVLALDNGLLDYSALAKDSDVLVQAAKADTAALRKALAAEGLDGRVHVSEMGSGVDRSRYRICHIKANTGPDTVRILENLGGFDLLAIDVNSEPLASAAIASDFSGLLNRDAILLMTVKLVNGRIEEHMESVRRLLSPHYRNLHFKKLPHNREEVTLCATI